MLTTTTLHNTQTIVKSPFYIGLKSKCKGVSSDGYLPALVFSDESREKPEEEKWTERQWNMVLQLRTQVLYLQKRLNEHLDQKAQEKVKESRSGIEI